MNPEIGYRSGVCTRPKAGIERDIVPHFSSDSESDEPGDSPGDFGSYADDDEDQFDLDDDFPKEIGRGKPLRSTNIFRPIGSVVGSKGPSKTVKTKGLYNGYREMPKVPSRKPMRVLHISETPERKLRVRREHREYYSLMRQWHVYSWHLYNSYLIEISNGTFSWRKCRSEIKYLVFNYNERGPWGRVCSLALLTHLHTLRGVYISSLSELEIQTKFGRNATKGSLSTPKESRS
jgi:hypothetical protein